MSTLFPRNRAESGKTKKAKVDPVSLKPAKTVEDGLFGVAVKKKRIETSADSSKTKRMKGSGGDDTTKEEDLDNVGELVRMVTSISGKGKVPKIVPPSFKGLAAGTLLSGIIKIITKRQIFIALPYGLNGLVSSNDVSDFKLFKDSNNGILEDDDDEEEEEKSSKKSTSTSTSSSSMGSTLEALFTVGQSVRCVVLSSSETNAGRRSVRLSLKPSVVNRGIFLEHLGVGCGVYGAVASVEDHGYVIGFGVDGFNGFLKAKDTDGIKYRVGQPIDMSIQKINMDSKTINVSTKQTSVLTAMCSVGKTVLPLRAIKPGALVSLKVTRIVENGLLVNMMMGGKPSKVFGVIEHNHLQVPCKREHWQVMFNKGDSIASARVLSLDYATRAVTFTLRPHLLAMRPPTSLPPVGIIVEEATILRADPREGLLLGVPAGLTSNSPTKTIKASSSDSVQLVGVYVPISKAASAEDRGVNTEKGSKTWKIEKNFTVGDAIRVRVLATNIMEGTGIGTVIESEIDASVETASALEVGQVMKGPIMAIEHWGVLVDLGGLDSSNTIKALVTNIHLADATVTDPKKRFRIGAKVNCRILSIENNGKKVMATMKKALVTDDSENILTSYHDAIKYQYDKPFYGFVSKISKSSLSVTFYNKVYGVIESKTLIEQGVHDVAEAYSTGQVVKCRVLKCTNPDSASTPKLKLSLDIPGSLYSSTAASSSTKDTGDVDDEESKSSSNGMPSIGTIVGGTILHREAKPKMRSGLEISLDAPYKGIKAILPANHISDCSSLSRILYKSTKFSPGSKLTNLLVFSHKNGNLCLSMKTTLLTAASSTTKLILPSSFEDIEKISSKKNKSSLIAGVVGSIESYGVFVEFMNGFSALIPRGQMPYRISSHNSEEILPALTSGDVVLSSCYSVDKEKKRLALSCSPNHTACSRSILALKGSNRPTYLQQLFSDRYYAAESEYNRNCEGGGTIVKSFPNVRKYPLGTTTDAKVIELLSDGSLKLCGDDDQTIMIAPAIAGGYGKSSELGCHAAGAKSLSINDIVKVRVLDVNFGDSSIAPSSSIAKAVGVISSDHTMVGPMAKEFYLIVSCSSSLVKSGRSKRRKAILSLFESPSASSSSSKSEEKKAKKKKSSSTDTEKEVTINNEELNNNGSGLLVGNKVQGKVILVNILWGYAIVSLNTSSSSSSSQETSSESSSEGSVLAYLMLSDYSCPSLAIDNLIEANKCKDEKEASGSAIVVGEQIECHIIHSPLPTPWLNGYDKSDKNDTSSSYFPHKENIFVARSSDMEEALAQASGKVSSTTSASSNKNSSSSSLRKDGNIVIEEDATWSDLIVGNFYKATCKAIREDGCSVVLNSSESGGSNQVVIGFIKLIELVSNAKEAMAWSQFKSHKSYGVKIEVGSEIIVELLNINREEKSIELSAHSCGGTSQPNRNFGHVNTTTIAQILDYDSIVSGNPSIMVSLGCGKKGRISITEICDSDEWTSMNVNDNGFVTGVESSSSNKNKINKITPGNYCDVVLLSSFYKKNKKNSLGKNVINCSMRKSRMVASTNDGDKNTSEATLNNTSAMPPIGAVVRGFVSSTSSSGCFVQLEHDIVARVLIKDLADSFVQDPVTTFPPGRLVAGCVLSVNTGGNISLTLRPSKVLGDARKEAVAAVEIGDICKGVIHKVETFGVFVKLENGVVGLCHLTEAADRFIKDLSKVYSVGDLVMAKVLRVNKAKGQLSLGLKASYFEGLPDSDDEEEDDDDSEGENSDEEDNEDDDEDDDEDEEDEDDDEDDEDEEGIAAMEDGDDDSDAEDFATKLQQKMMEEDGDDDEEDDEEEEEDDDDEDREEDDDDEDESDSDEETMTSKKKANLFAWDDFELSAPTKNDEEDDEDDDDDDDDEINGKRKRSANSKKRAREEEERQIRKQEQDLVEKQESSVTDEWNEDDFERSLLATPNDSSIWVRYMASKLRSMDLNSCRTIAKRALKTILFREEEEKFNIWVAFINLEFKYGNKQTLTEVITSACAAAHPKRIRLRVASMLEEAHLGQSNEDDEVEVGNSTNNVLDEEAGVEAEAAYAVAAKKHKTSKQVWSAYLRYRLRAGDDQGAAKLLQRALQCLAKHKHIFVISKFAQDEFAFGSIERGRTIFEELLAVHGVKRLDLWNVFIDKEIKSKQYDAARALFSRLITLKLGNKPMKAVFKKWLTFEKVHGSTKTQAEVKAAARDYVQRALEQSK